MRVSNARHNLLTRLIDLRYWVAFNQERASHAFYGAVLCCSGPLSMYRRDVLDDVWGRYTAQTFRGIECTYGDDRHLTNLVLRTGLSTTFEPVLTMARSADAPRLVLVVDDETDVRELVARKLVRSGFEVITASNGAEALELVAAHRPDLMLLDVMMPGMSGFDVCRTVRAERGGDAPPVIFLSARSQPEDIRDGLAAGAEDYVVKPFSPNELVRRSVMVLERGD